MSDFDWDDTSSEETPQGPKALRELYEKNKQEKADLQKQLDALNSRVKEQELSKAFEASGLPVKAVNLFPRDLEPTEENISKFVADYGDMFNAPSNTATATETAVIDDPAQNVNAEAQKQFQQMSQATSTGTPANSTPVQDLERALANPNIYDELPYKDFIELLRKAGNAKV